VEYGIPHQPKLCGKCSIFITIGSKGRLISTIDLGGEESSGPQTTRIFSVQEIREGRGLILSLMRIVDVLHDAVNIHHLILSVSTTPDM
jgi:hypothetical protein